MGSESGRVRYRELDTESDLVSIVFHDHVEVGVIFFFRLGLKNSTYLLEVFPALKLNLCWNRATGTRRG